MHHLFNQPNFMIDIETLGSTPGSVITSIGAVRFDLAGTHESFYYRIDPETCIAAGLTIDVSTVLWWMKQSDEARAEFGKPAEPLEEVLHHLTAFLCDGYGVAVWGNSAGFDCGLLAAAYRATGIPVPWRFTNERCYRTLKAMFPHIPLTRTGTHHNALDDATTQALHAIDILLYLQLPDIPSPSTQSTPSIESIPSTASVPSRPSV